MSNIKDDNFLRQKGWIETAPGIFEKPKARTAKDAIYEYVATGVFTPLAKSAHRINIKPMSVNSAWKGRRFKTKEYSAYEKSAISMLPKITLPKSPYKLELVFAVSSKNSDIDNPIKLFTDILQKKYKFNDKEIHELHVKKIHVEKRQEYCEFKISSL